MSIRLGLTLKVTVAHTSRWPELGRGKTEEMVSISKCQEPEMIFFSFFSFFFFLFFLVFLEWLIHPCDLGWMSLYEMVVCHRGECC